ncbi:MAG TPA: L,D-transpeptidase family protein [Mycobacteriales bacterium]|nr:L,D-transpeptidase family protein [Mycobacteriales bacterium]
MPRRPLSAAVALTALALALAGCTSGGSRTVTALPSPVTVDDAPSYAPVVEPSTSEASASPTPSPSPTKKLPPPYDVLAVQKRLTVLKYYIGAIDGKPGLATRSAIMAFQKVQGLAIDFNVGKATLAALDKPKSPVLKGSSPADRVEIDLTKQVLYLVENGRIERVMPVSSGNGKRYLQKNGRQATALTPTGYYKIERRIEGVREADLGTLYDPQYFYRGWAIHGSNSVPSYPASHGCVRVTRSDAKWLLEKINVGTSVYLYGGTHTFPAGSSAPGTDNPSGDTPSDEPSESPSPSPSESPSASPSPSGFPPLPTASPSPSASPSPTPPPTPTPSPEPAPS